ncbi:universal stress protein [Pseudonocardia sp. GCM10023141]|uniref:universal stress protein n=1 Tax=Pseudonocardia sp. GCM10023141 TaxID=3252653 RepID=UPI003614237E
MVEPGKHGDPAGPVAAVLVGVDGSDSALRAVRWAAAEAARLDAPLRVINAFGLLPADRYGAVMAADAGGVLLEAAHEIVSAAIAHARAVAPHSSVTGEVLRDHPIPRLITESRHAQLLVVGDRGRGGITGMLVGSVAVALAAHAACPVVVVRGVEHDDPADACRPVVVGVGEPPDSVAVVRFAFEEAARRGAPLVAVHVWRHPALMRPEAALLVDWDAVATVEWAELSAAVACCAAMFPGVPVQRVHRRGIAARELVELSTEAQLVVVGTRGHGAVSGIFLGSISHALLHHSSCPVAVVRPDPVGPSRWS